MKHTFLSLALASLLVIPVALAAQAQQTRQRTPSAPAQTSLARRAAQAAPARQTHASAEFVSYDAKTKVITIKDDKGQTSTAPVQGDALREMTRMRLKAGDHLMLTYRDNAKGEHQAVTDVRLSKSST